MVSNYGPQAGGVLDGLVGCTAQLVGDLLGEICRVKWFAESIGVDCWVLAWGW